MLPVDQFSIDIEKYLLSLWCMEIGFIDKRLNTR
nr:MAG TPA: hypothetical protein [Caudoviricetes sp.]